MAIAALSMKGVARANPRIRPPRARRTNSQKRASLRARPDNQGAADFRLGVAVSCLALYRLVRAPIAQANHRCARRVAPGRGCARARPLALLRAPGSAHLAVHPLSPPRGWGRTLLAETVSQGHPGRLARLSASNGKRRARCSGGYAPVTSACAPRCRPNGSARAGRERALPRRSAPGARDRGARRAPLTGVQLTAQCSALAGVSWRFRSPAPHS